MLTTGINRWYAVIITITNDLEHLKVWGTKVSVQLAEEALVTHSLWEGDTLLTTRDALVGGVLIKLLFNL